MKDKQIYTIYNNPNHGPNMARALVRISKIVLAMKEYYIQKKISIVKNKHGEIYAALYRNFKDISAWYDEEDNTVVVHTHSDDISEMLKYEPITGVIVSVVFNNDRMGYYYKWHRDDNDGKPPKYSYLDIHLNKYDWRKQ